MQRDFETRVQAAFTQSWERENALLSIERRAASNPILVAEWLLVVTVGLRRLYRRYLRSRFGIAAKDRIDGPWRIVNPARAPRGRREKDLCLTAIATLCTWDLAFAAMIILGNKAFRNEEDHALPMCEACVGVLKVTPVLSGSVMELAESEILKERGTANLAGWLRTQLNRDVHKRMAAALEEGGDRSTHDRLLRELPATAFSAWDEWNPDEEPLRPGTGGRSLVSRTADLLSRLGSEETERGSQPYERLGEDLDPGRSDERLEEFELREEARWKALWLRSLVEKAGLSAHEMRVHELDLKLNFDTKAIAHEMGVKPETVRSFRKRYRDKLREAAAM